jgi:hypothetical protein
MHNGPTSQEITFGEIGEILEFGAQANFWDEISPGISRQVPEFDGSLHYCKRIEPNPHFMIRSNAKPNRIHG